MQVTLYTSSFCAPCGLARDVIARAGDLVPAMQVDERDVARFPDAAEADDIRSTPTTIVSDADGREVFRASGVPTLPQLLTALARAI